MKPLFIVAFLDGRPGHEKQTRGVLNALARMTPIDVEYKRLASPSFQSSIREWAGYIRSFIKMRNLQSYKSNVNLIIGTGSGTHIPMLLLKQKSGAKVVTCMTPDFLFKSNYYVILNIAFYFIYNE